MYSHLYISHLLYKSQNTCSTVLFNHSSNVNLSLLQSVLAHISLIWLVIFFWYSSFHFHTSSRNFSLHNHVLLIHSFISFFSTTVCVEIPAWSVPGIHKVSSHFNLWYLTIISSRAKVRECPIWRFQVTFGGGIGI